MSTPALDPRTALENALSDRYTLLEEIGRGGMGVVYAARDERHHRRVAVKVLSRARVDSSVGAERFLAEIRTTAGLSHPNIVPLLDSGHAADYLYYLMPLVEGESLQTRLRNQQRLPVRDALRIACDVAEGLAYAHRQGVIHRDVKPGNILLTPDGHATLVDFGIAHALSHAASRTLTPEGLVVGTPAYMSPEQAAGQEIDARADVYALGMVLYEMLSGTVTDSAQRPQPLSGIRADVSRTLSEVVVRALARDPEERFRTAEEVSEALEEIRSEYRRGGALPPGRSAAGATSRLGSFAGRLGRKLLPFGLRWLNWRNALLGIVVVAATWVLYTLLSSGAKPLAPGAEVIAVLPFTVSGSGMEGFGTGIVSLLGPNLDGVGGIRTVSSRTVVQQWEESRNGSGPGFEEALAIGREVGAGSVLLGSVVSQGERVRLLAELHSVDGERLAQADVQGALPDILSLVDSLTVHLVRDVWRSREPIPDLRVSAITTGSLPAMRAFLRGEEYYRRSRWDSATTEFRHAVGLDSTFALAYFRLADSEVWRTESVTSESQQAMEAAYRYQHRLPSREGTLVAARQLDLGGNLAAIDTMEAYVSRYPQDGEGWYFLGDVRFHGRKLLGLPPPALYRPFERALELRPTLSLALIHPLQWTLVNGDSLRFARYMSQLDSLPGGHDEEFYARWSRILWGPPDSVDIYLDRTFRDRSASALLPVLVSGVLDPDLDPSALLAALDRRAADVRRGDPDWRFLTERRLLLLGGLGRVARVRRELDLLWEVAPDLASVLEVRLVVAGVAPAGFARRGVEYLEALGGTAAAYWLAMHDVRTGRTRSAAERIRAARGAGDVEEVYSSLIQGASGWIALTEGDTARGLRLIERGLKDAGYWNTEHSGMLRHVWSTTLTASAGSRDEGIHLLRNAEPEPELIVPNQLALGRALESAGDAEGARRAYLDVLRLWSGADAGLEENLNEAVKGLERLTPES